MLDEFEQSIPLMSNAKLYEEFLDSTIPDSYDGEWTDEGLWKFEILKEEFEKRLTDWLKS